MKRAANKLFCEMDFFSTPPTLRSKNEPYSASLGLSVFSLLVLGLFIYLFIKGLIDCINLDNSQMGISSTISVQYQESRNIPNIMLALSIPLSDINGNPFIKPEQKTQYFEAIAMTYFANGSINFLPMSPCKAQQWKILGDNYQSQFTKYNLQNALCLPQLANSQNITSDHVFFYFTLYSCQGPQCKNMSDILDYYNKVLVQYSVFTVTAYILTTVVQINNPDPVDYIIDVKRFAGSKVIGTMSFLKYQRFTINTDSSLFPFVNHISSNQGYVFSQQFYSQYVMNLTDIYSNSVISVNVYFSPIVRNYSRKVKTIDENISYVGGLLGIILIVLTFFFGSYDQYKYDLRVAQNSLNYDSDGYKFTPKDLNIINYCQYSLYDWIDYLCCRKPQWEQCKRIDETRQQGINMIDVNKLFRRLQFLQRVVGENTNHNVFMCMTLIQSDTIQQTRKKRKFFEYYHQVIGSKSAASVQDALTDKVVAFKYLDQLDRQFQKQKKNPSLLKKLSFQQLKESKQIDYQTQNTKNSETEIYQSLMHDLRLQELPELCQKVSHYTVIAKQASSLRLNKQFQKMQKQLAKSLIQLSKQNKQTLIKKMPILVLHRLRLAAIKMKKAEAQIQNDVDNSQSLQQFQSRKQVQQIFKQIGIISIGQKKEQ